MKSRGGVVCCFATFGTRATFVVLRSFASGAFFGAETSLVLDDPFAPLAFRGAAGLGVDGDGLGLLPFDVVRFAAGLVAAVRFAAFVAFLLAGFAVFLLAGFVAFFAAGFVAFFVAGFGACFVAFSAAALRGAGFPLVRLLADGFGRPATFRPAAGFSRGAAFFTAFLTLATPPLRLVTDVARVRQLFGTQIYKWCNECQLKSSPKATSPAPLS